MLEMFMLCDKLLYLEIKMKKILKEMYKEKIKILNNINKIEMMQINDANK